MKISNFIIEICFQKTCTLELWIEIFSNINVTLEKRRKHIIYIWHSYNICTSQYGILTVKDPILLHKFTNENDGLIEHSEQSYKV
jgi:hypothetical protein